MDKILLIFTGGTICSSEDKESGKSQSNAIKTGSLLEKNFNLVYKNKVKFISVYLKQDVLSENMTFNTLNELIKILKKSTTKSNYKGVLIMHGTDTLAYTSSILSILLAGYTIPIFLVSAHLNLKDKLTNGYINFTSAVEMILNGVLPNVYVVYENVLNRNYARGKTLVHLGAKLLNSFNFSNNFHSQEEVNIEDYYNGKYLGKSFETNSLLIDKINKLSNGVLLINPYTNLNYKAINLKGVKAIVHGTYHSESVCIGRAKNPSKDKNKNLTIDMVKNEDKPYSILNLLNKCKAKNIPVFLVPCNEKTAKYGTTANAISCGAIGIKNITIESGYAKTVIGVSLGLKGEELIKFLNKSVNYENTVEIKEF